MGRVVANGLGASLDASFTALDGIVRDYDGHRHAKVAADAAKFILVSREADTTAGPSSDVIEQFAIRMCAAVIEHKFFGNARQYLVNEGKIADQVAAYDWQRRIEQLNWPAVRKVASQLLENPRAERLRAPKRTAPRELTSSLLSENLTASKAPDRTPSRLPR